MSGCFTDQTQAKPPEFLAKICYSYSSCRIDMSHMSAKSLKSLLLFLAQARSAVIQALRSAQSQRAEFRAQPPSSMERFPIVTPAMHCRTWRVVVVGVQLCSSLLFRPAADSENCCNATIPTQLRAKRLMLRDPAWRSN